VSTHDDRSGTRRTGPLVIAVDGPSGSGKSTVSREVAQRLGLSYLDTGAMYRALTWWCLRNDVPLDDHDAVAEASRRLPLEMGTDPAGPTVRVDSVDVGAQIRTTEVSARVSAVATNLAVRAVMRERQRELIAADPRGTVAEGRDITTVVAPDADVRVLLTADEAARLARRALEVHGSDDDDAIAATRDHVVRRDEQDSTVATFTEAAEGVTVIDSSGLSFEETVTAVLALVDPALTDDAGDEGSR
jgi:cytidylate kinase